MKTTLESFLLMFIPARLQGDNNKRSEQDEIKIETEKCILCKCDTSISQNIPIDSRKYYIEGAGQLCKQCFEDIYSGRGNTFDLW